MISQLLLLLKDSELRILGSLFERKVKPAEPTKEQLAQAKARLAIALKDKTVAQRADIIKHLTQYHDPAMSVVIDRFIEDPKALAL
jgi:hypothetical protein